MKIRLLQTIAKPDFTAQAGSVIDVEDSLGLGLTKAGAAQYIPKPANIGLNATRATNTIKAYESDWRHFENWCQERGLRLDVSPNIVATYLEDCSKELAYSTIKRRLNAIIAIYRERGEVIDRRALPLYQTMEGIRRTLARHSLRRPKALLTEDIKAICDILPTTTKIIRDRTVILLGFVTGMRGSEIVGLDWNNVNDGCGYLRLSEHQAEIVITKSKTDQRGYGRTLILEKGKNEQTCPMEVLHKWWRACGKPKSGAMFSRLTPQGKTTSGRLSCSAVSSLVKEAVARIGLAPEYYSSHSLRAGHVTQSAMNGASEREIMRTTGHRSTSTLHRYMREAQMHSLPTSIDKLGL